MSPCLLSLWLSVCLPVAAPPEPPTDVPAMAILREWDAARANAWANGDPAALAELYTARSAAGRTDRAMLHEWARRGLRVEGMRMQLLAVEVRADSDDRVVLVVTDRLTGAIAVGPGLRVPLPRDAASTRTITLRAVAGEWRVVTVADQARPVRTTSSTERSWNS